MLWLGTLTFAGAIVALYVAALPAGTPDDWNTILPALYTPGQSWANAGMLAHFLFGALLLVAGPVQLIGRFRTAYPKAHRIVGRCYAVAAFLTGAGGCLYIAVRGTIGGPVMSTAFMLYGLCMMAASVQTVRYAMQRRLDAHRAWAIRLFTLVISSMLYRVHYTIWSLAFGRLGRTRTFDGPFDYVMDFAFFLIPLAVAERIIRARPSRATWSAALPVPRPALWFAVAYLGVATIFLIGFSWGPIIAWRLGVIE